MFTNPLSHAGYPPGVTGTPQTQPSQVRAATVAEASAGVLDNVYISPLTAQSATALDFASPPVLGFGSTTPRPVAATTVTSTTTMIAGTSITATLGNITATNGNLSLGTAGNKINIATGVNASAGTSDAMIAGSVTVATTAITANSLVFFATGTLGGVGEPQAYRVSARTPGTSFTIDSSSAGDTSTVNWIIIN